MAESAADMSRAEALAERLGLPIVAATDTTVEICLQVGREHLALRDMTDVQQGAVVVDFVGGALAHRRVYGGGRGQLIAKAIGLKKLKHPSVIDATAGLGRDAFVLATLGCHVRLIERSPIVAALVEDGLARASSDPSFDKIDMRLTVGNAIEILKSLSPADYPEVVYLDPMFPERTKSALVKKEMRLLKKIVGDDPDADQLLHAAIAVAKKRVVVKRPKGAPALGGLKPDLVYHGKSNRFDVYL